MKKFSARDNQVFWEHESSYKGDVVSSTIILLTKRYVGSVVLDAGAGNGALVQCLMGQRSVDIVVGVDLASKGGGVLKGDIRNLCFGDSGFDTVFCTDVLEHLNDEDLLSCIREMNRVLKPGGRLILTTLDQEDLGAELVRCPECGCIFHRWGHQQVFSVERLSNLFGDNGFRVIKTMSLNLHFLSRLGILGRLFYLFRLDKLFKRFTGSNYFDFDLFMILTKSKERLRKA